MLVATGCGPQQPAAELPGVTLGEPLRAAFGNVVLIDYECLFGDDGSVFVFAHIVDQGTSRLVYRRYNGQQWSRPANVADLGKLRGSIRISMASAWLQPGRAALLWSVRKQSADQVPIKASFWTGKSWTAPKDTPGTMSYGGTRGLVLWQARPGALACIYTGDLQPVEAYSVGGHSWAPVKPFYMEGTQGSWKRPVPMTPRSRWSYWDITLFVHGQTAHFLAQVTYAGLLTIRPSQLEHRVLRGGGKWSGPARVADRGGNISSPSAAMDSTGRLHVVYEFSLRTGGVSHYRTKKGRSWSRRRSLGDAGRRGCVGGDRNGNVYVCWSEGGKARNDSGKREYVPATDHLKVIVDGRASLPIEIKALHVARIYPGPRDGAFLTGHTGRASISIQKISSSDR